MAVNLSILDRAVLVRDGEPVKIEPRFMAVLIRLSLDLGRTVDRAVLYADALAPRRRGVGAGDSRFVDAVEAERLRNAHVHKAISFIRQALDPARPGPDSLVLVTDAGANPGYRLQLDPACVDLLSFERMVTDTHRLPPAQAVRALEQALDLWRGRPLVDVADRAWARSRIEQVTELAREARQRLFDLYLELDQPEQAVPVGEELLRDDPSPELAARVRELRYGRRPAAALRRPVSFGPGNDVLFTVVYGDLLDQNDANLVVGFSNTFATDTTNNSVVSERSLQGQLAHRLWGGDFARLDRDLRAALARVPADTRERIKGVKGKPWRFEVGTVAPLPHAGRQVFAVAYSRADGESHTESSVAELRLSMDNVWAKVRRVGQFLPVAVPIVGTGLARIDGFTYLDSVRLTLESFFDAARSGRLADEVRIVVHPSGVAKLDIAAVDALIGTLAATLGERAPA